MKLLFVGPQGSGKGTQAKGIAEKLGICHISTGDLLRDVEGELKTEVDSYILKGSLVPDELMIKVLQVKFDSEECKNGYILDGFPRNKEQVKHLDKIMKIDKVFLIDISDEVAIKRVSSRLNCRKCGAVFNSITNHPKIPGECDSCKGELYIREDDKPEAIRKRLEIYHKETEPVLKKYKRRLIRINGEQEIDIVTNDILKELKQN